MADLVGLPDGLDHLINAAVDAVAFDLRTARISPRFKEVSDGGKFVEDGPSRGLCRMRGKDRPEI